MQERYMVLLKTSFLYYLSFKNLASRSESIFKEESFATFFLVYPYQFKVLSIKPSFLCSWCSSSVFNTSLCNSRAVFFYDKNMLFSQTRCFEVFLFH